MADTAGRNIVVMKTTETTAQNFLGVTDLSLVRNQQHQTL